MKRVTFLAYLMVLAHVSMAAGQPQRYVLQLDYRFPPPDSVDSDYYIAHLTDLALMDDHRIAVLDQIQKVLLVVDRSGRLNRQIGRPGQGPGEFTMPWDVEYDSASNLLWVLDRDRIQAFSGADYGFSHLVRPTEMRPSEIVAADGNLFLTSPSAAMEHLVHCYNGQGELLWTVGTHIEREVARPGRGIYKMGGLAGVRRPSGSMLFAYVYNNFNDILLIDGRDEKLVHSDYPTIVEQDAVNRRVAPEWASDPREGPVPYTLTRNPVVMKDRLFLCVVYGTYQKETPIIEMALDGSVQRVWVIPAECGQPLSYAVEMADGWPVFWVGFSFPEPYVARMTASR